MKILHVIHSVDPERGGPAQAVLDQLVWSKTAGVDAYIATLSMGAQTGLNRLPDELRCRVVLFDWLGPDGGASGNFGVSIHFAKWFWQNASSFSVVHFHGLFDFLTEYGMA